MQTAKGFLLMIICVGLLGACGLRGPLYLPDEETTSMPSDDKQSDQAGNKEEPEKDKQQIPVSVQ